MKYFFLAGIFLLFHAGLYAQMPPKPASRNPSMAEMQMKLAAGGVSGPYKRKARLMAYLLMNACNEHLTSPHTALADIEEKIRLAGKRMNESVDADYKNGSFKDRNEDCLMIQKYVEAYLSYTATFHNSLTTRLNSKYFALDPTDIVLGGEAKAEPDETVEQYELGAKGMISISGTASVDAIAVKVNGGNEINIFKHEPQ